MVYTYEITTQSIFDSTADCIVAPVNTVGVMGKGLALEFKRRYPGLFPYYRDLCTQRTLSTFALWNIPHIGQFVGLCVTKYHWKERSPVDILRQSLISMRSCIQQYEFEYIALPQIGCGLGGLSWETNVFPLVQEILSPLSIHVTYHVD